MRLSLRFCLELGLLLVMITACATAASPKTPSTLEPTSVSRTTPSETPRSIATSEMLAPTTMASGCPLPALQEPVTSHFDPITSTDALAYSSDGLVLLFPSTNETVTIHSLASLGLSGVDKDFSWSPNATQIAFLYTDPRPEPCGYGYLMLADLSTGEVRSLTHTLKRYSKPAWSPDSEWLSFTEETGRLNVVQLSSSKLTTLSEQAFGLITPAWLDEKQIVYARSTGSEDSSDLVSQSLNGGTLHVLLKDISHLTELTLSTNGQQLAYIADGVTALIDLRTYKTQVLGSSPSDMIQWSPNGKYLLGRGGLTGIYLVRPDASESLEQLSVFGVLGLQSWSPDSQRFAVLAGLDDKRPLIGIYHMDSRTVDELPVTVLYPYALAWSPR